MAIMNSTEKKTVARKNVSDLFMDIFNHNDAVQFKKNAVAIMTEVDGEEYWVEVAFTVKQNKDTKTSPAFDPYEVREAWLEEERIKREEKAAKALEKKAKKNS